MRIGFQVDIEAPAERVWPFIDMPEYWPAWIPELHSMTYPDGFDREKPLGTRVRQVFRGRGDALAREGEITAYEPLRRMAMHLAGRSIAYDIDILLGPSGTGTFVVYEEVTTAASLPPRLLALLRQPFELRQISARMERLKKLSEEAVTPATAH